MVTTDKSRDGPIELDEMCEEPPYEVIFAISPEMLSQRDQDDLPNSNIVVCL